jgi:hypothetical protein
LLIASNFVEGNNIAPSADVFNGMNELIASCTQLIAPILAAHGAMALPRLRHATKLLSIGRLLQ